MGMIGGAGLGKVWAGGAFLFRTALLLRQWHRGSRIMPPCTRSAMREPQCHKAGCARSIPPVRPLHLVHSNPKYFSNATNHMSAGVSCFAPCGVEKAFCYREEPKSAPATGYPSDERAPRPSRSTSGTCKIHKVRGRKHMGAGSAGHRWGLCHCARMSSARSGGSLCLPRVVCVLLLRSMRCDSDTVRCPRPYLPLLFSKRALFSLDLL